MSMHRTPALQSRLPAVGTTIFTVMSALAQQHGAVNLGQGFPDFDCDPRLLDAVDAAMRAGHNQYPPMTGVPSLREAVAAKIEALYGRRYDPGSEITVTAGATQAILTAILAIVHPGRRSHRAGALLRQLRTQHRTGRRHAWCACPLPGTSGPTSKPSRGADAAHPRVIIVNSPAQPERHGVAPEDMERLAGCWRRPTRC
jgi:methionine aminotransferase